MKIAAVGDLHFYENYGGTHASIFSDVHTRADILLLCGDLTNFGLPREAEHLAAEALQARVPVLAVLGNHDHQSDRVYEIKDILKRSKIIFLEDEPFVYQNVGFAGVKGFGGGFNGHTLTSFGEKMIKMFVEETIKEAMTLENSLRALATAKKVAALHYSPIAETVVGEPQEIFPFLGSSRLAETIDRFNVNAVFHGHSHHGKLEGKTPRGTPVYNCSYEIMKTNNAQPYMIVEI